MTAIFYWPDYGTIRKARFYVQALSRGYESQLTRQGLYERLAGERWTAELECVPLTRPGASQLRAWLSKIDGRTGAIAMTDFTYQGPAGAISYTLSDGTLNPAILYGFSDSTVFTDVTKWADLPAVVTLGAQTAPLDDSVQLAGLPVSLAGALAEGDLIQIGHEFEATQLVQVVAGGNADATGALRVTVRPRIRAAFLAGTCVYLTAPKCVMRLADDDQGGIAFDLDQATHAVKLVEAI